MASELVMYMSSFVIGIVMLSTFTGLYYQMDNRATAVAIESGLDSVLQSLSDSISSLYQTVSVQLDQASSLDAVTYLDFPAYFEDTSYTVTMSVISGDLGQTVIQLIAQATNNPELKETMIVQVPSTNINAYGTLTSTDKQMFIQFSYDGTSSIFVLESN